VIDNFEAYFPSQQATELQSKLWIFNVFGERHPLEHLGANIKDDLCHQAFISRRKHAEFCARALDGLRKDLKIQVLEVLVQHPTTYLAEKGFSVLVID